MTNTLKEYQKSYSKNNRANHHKSSGYVANDRQTFNHYEMQKMLLMAPRWNFDYGKFETYKVFVAFTDQEDTYKPRPVVVLKDNGDTCTCFKCTSKKHEGESYWDKMDIEEWSWAGFDRPSYIIPKETIEISKDLFYKRMGKLQKKDIQNLQEIGL